MRLDGVRITLRLHRFELVSFGIGLASLVVAAFAVSAWVEGLRPGSECLAMVDLVPPGCQESLNKFYTAQQSLGIFLAPLLLITYAVGLFLGVPIVARELERGTVRLAWSLAPSRWRWFVARVVPVLAVLIVLTFAAGVALDHVFAVSNPREDVSNSFTGYGARGGLLASRAVFIFAVSVVVGSIIGRALPAIIIAAIVATVGLTGGTQVHQEILKAEAIAIPVDDQNFNGGGSGHMYFDQKFVLPDGRLVGWEYFGGFDQPYDQEGNPLYPMVSIVVPGERYRFVEAREALALAGGSLVALLLAAAVVSRRRPG